MNRPEDDEPVLGALRELPSEVSLDHVKHMVAAFPVAVGITAWLAVLKFHLNSLLMTTAGTLIVGASAYLLSASTPGPAPVATSTEAPFATTELLVTTGPELPAVVFDPPAPSPTPKPKPKPKQEELACMVRMDQDSAWTSSVPEEQEPVSMAVQPMQPQTEARPMQGMATPRPTGTRTYELRDFSGITVLSSMRVTLEIGDFAITATGDETLLQQLKVEVKDKVLQLDLRAGQRSVAKSEDIHFRIRMPVAHTLSITGSGTIYAERIPHTTNLDLNVSGSGSMEVPHLEGAKHLTMLVTGAGHIRSTELLMTDRLQMTVSGSGSIGVTGSVRAGLLDVLLNGSGSVDCQEVVITGTTSMNVNGSGDVTMTGCTGRVDVMLMGSGNVYASGMVTLGGKVTQMGSGSVFVNCEAPLDRFSSGSGTIHTSGSVGDQSQRGVVKSRR